MQQLKQTTRIIFLALLTLLVLSQVQSTHAAFNDVTLTTSTNISVGGYTLNVTGSSAVVQSMTINTSSFSVILASGSSIQVTSPTYQQLSVDVGTFTISNVCVTNSSVLSLASSGPTGTVTIIPSATICSTPVSSGGGGGGGYCCYFPPAPDTSQISPPPVPTSSLAFPSATSFRLINNNGTFYLIKNGQIHGVTSPGILFSYGLDFTNAKPATTTDIALPKGDLLLPDDGALVKSAQDKTVYLVSGGQRHAFTSAKVFTGLDFTFSSVLLVTNPELQALPKGTYISNSAAVHLNGLNINYKGTIYWLNNNMRHPYPSLAVYNTWNLDNDFSMVVPANAADLQLPEGEAVTARIIQ